MFILSDDQLEADAVNIRVICDREELNTELEVLVDNMERAGVSRKISREDHSQRPYFVLPLKDKTVDGDICVLKASCLEIQYL